MNFSHLGRRVFIVAGEVLEANNPYLSTPGQNILNICSNYFVAWMIVRSKDVPEGLRNPVLLPTTDTSLNPNFLKTSSKQSIFGNHQQALSSALSPPI